MRGDEVLSEAYAMFYSRGIFEMGIITGEEHRWHGLATIACAFAIQACEEQGCETLWCCSRRNLASAALARKLGNTREREFGGVLFNAVNS